MPRGRYFASFCHCHPALWSCSSVIWTSVRGVENECCSWFFVLVTLSPTVVGALSAQLTQLNGPFPPSALFRGLPRCWRVCQHGYHFFIFSLFILSTSYSTAGSLPVKEHSSLKFLRVYFTTFGRAFYVFLRVLIFNFLQPRANGYQQAHQLYCNWWQKVIIIPINIYSILRSIREMVEKVSLF